MSDPVRLKFSFSDALVLEAGPLRLMGGVPALDGEPRPHWRGELVQQAGGSGRVEYRAADGDGPVFGLEWNQLSPDELRLRYWLDSSRLPGPPDSFGLHFRRVEGARAYLRSGYMSWDGSEFVDLDGLKAFGEDEPRPELGYALTQLLPEQGDESLVLGFERHERFQQTCTWHTRREVAALTLLTLWDQKRPDESQRCTADPLLAFVHPGVEAGLRRWAQRVAAAARRWPRLSQPAITGWCSWYNLYAAIDEQNILQHLASVREVTRREGLPMRVFQIDDGFTPEMGDWLEVKPQFPHGMKAVLDEIRRAGFIPGLWIAPFMVGNRSHLYQQHPDWIVRDRTSGGPLVQMSFYGEFRWHKRSEEYYILDTTHPDALEYLRQVFRTWRSEWGCEYFKTDFMHFGCAHGPERAAWHTPGLTRMEIWRQAAEMIREEIGEVLWLGCGFPLWAGIGLVDGVRTGRDAGTAWESNTQSLLASQAARSFPNGVLWQADPDCILLRERFHHLSDAQVQALALYAGMIGGVTMTSDDLGELSPARLRLWKQVLTGEIAACRYPFLGRSQVVYEPRPASLDSNRVRRVPRLEDPVLVQVRECRDGAAVFLLNSGDQPETREYPLPALGLARGLHLREWPQESVEGPVESLRVDLPACSGKLFFLA